MLWIFALALIMPIDIGFCATTGEGVSDTTVPAPVNLTAITWEHAVNRQNKLTEVLGSNVNMIEADVFIGKLLGTDLQENHVIMAHGPSEYFSDLSLDEFLKQVHEYNKNKVADEVKGIKLDFKSNDTAAKSVEICLKYWKTPITPVNYAIWLNADIVRSSVGSAVAPIDPFIENLKDIKDLNIKFTWSLGWTTKWTDDGVTSGKYTEEDVDNMIMALGEQANQTITFPVRAGLVANSTAEMKKLLATYKNSTLTVWSSPLDDVNAAELNKFIIEIGIDKVYLDVPKILSNKLNLGSEDKTGKSSANKIAHIGLLSIIMLIFTRLF